MLIYLNLPAEDQYEILIPVREKLLMWPLTISEVCPHGGFLWWFADSLEYRQYSPYSWEVSLHLHLRSSFLFFCLPQWHYCYGSFQLLNGSCSGREHGDHELHLELGKFRSLLQMWFVQMKTWQERVNKERLLICRWDTVTKSSRGASGESGTKGTNVIFSNYHLPAQGAMWFIGLSQQAASVDN